MQKKRYIRRMLQEMGHEQPCTPIQMDNSTAEGVINNKIQPKCTKAMDMRFYWDCEHKMCISCQRQQSGVHGTRHCTHFAETHSCLSPELASRAQLQGCVGQTKVRPGSSWKLSRQYLKSESLNLSSISSSDTLERSRLINHSSTNSLHLLE
jgi:hypothetical protein